MLSLGISVINPQQALASNYFDFLANIGSAKVEEQKEEKYFSVDENFNKCGEAKFDRSKFWLYKPFEPGLRKSDTNNPCRDRKYDEFKTTQTHKFGPFEISYDLYGPEWLDIDAAEKI